MESGELRHLSDGLAVCVMHVLVAACATCDKMSDVRVHAVPVIHTQYLLFEW